MKQIRAIVFDMDGLMVDSEPLSRQAWDEFLRPYSGQISDTLQSQIIGLRADVSAPLIQEAFAVPLSVSEMIAQRAEIYARIRAQGVPIMPGLLELQAAISARRIPWAVASSSGRRHVTEILTQLGLLDKAHATACGDEVAHGKPAPDLYLLAATRLGIDPADCLALEDSLPGVQAAVAAGMAVIAIPNEHTSDADFGLAAAVYPSLHQVAARLDEVMQRQI